MKKSSFIICVSLLLMASIGSKAQLQNSFKTPSAENRPNLNIHNTPKDAGKQDSILNQYLLNGYGGLATNVNWTDDYLKNDSEMQSTFRFAKSARSKGMNVWLYDENTYPSGMAGGSILNEHPDWEVEGLQFKDSVINGPSKIHWNIMQGNLVVMKGVPVINGKNQLGKTIDIKKYALDNALNWDVPKGEWRVVQITTNVLRNGYQSGTVRGGKVRQYPSLLMPEVTQQFIELTHKRYTEVLGSKLGSLFYSTFTDEPSLMAQPYVNLGYGVYPWKKNLSEGFEKHFGYKLEDKLLQLMLDDGNEGQKLRYQYFSLVSEMMSQNYFRAIKEYCHSQNMKSGGHLLLEETMMAQVPLYGDIMACYREMDVPGIDVLTGMPEYTRRYLYSSRLASSATELEGRSEVMSEICPVSDRKKNNGKEAPTNDVKGTVNRQLVGGVTRFNNYLKLDHASQQEKMVFNTYVARVSTMMAGGVRASKIAVLYPIETMWSKFRPLPTWLKNWDDINGGDPKAQKTEKLFGQVSDLLYDNQWEFSYIDTKALLESKVTGGHLIHGNLNWEVLILPGVETLPIPAWQVVEAFVKSGGKVIAIDALPLNSSTDFPSTEIKKVTDSVFKNKETDRKAIYVEKFSAAGVQDILSSSIQRDFTISPANIPVLCSHKRMDGHDVLLVTNDSNQKQQFTLSFNSARKIEKWDPNTGEVSDANNPVAIELDAFNGIILKVEK